MNLQNAKVLPFALPVLALGFLAACGGHHSSTPTPSYATTLTYTNPTAPSGFYLQAEAATNGKAHLVLDLVGPSGVVAQGVSFFLTCDPASATWSKTGNLYAVAGTTYTLGTAPQAFATKVNATTGDLQVGIYQKAGAVAFGTAPVVSVALDVKTGTLTPGTVVNFLVTPGLASVYLDANGVVQTIQTPIAVGKLVAN